MRKKIVSLILSILFLLQTSVFAANVKVYSEDETEQLVNKLISFGVFNKVDDEAFFGDSYPIKRYEAAEIICNMLGVNDFASNTSQEVVFFDVPQYCEYIGAVNFVASLGIMTANENGMFLPENEMEVGHVLKAMVVALGYQWKATSSGGYPSGYLRVANELNLMDGISKSITDKATRLDFLKILDNSLEAPICLTTGIGQEKSEFEINEDVNLLTEYHDIFIGKGIVKNDKLISISTEVEPNDEKVKIGALELFVNGVNDIYSYLGHHVEFYYKKDSAEDRLYLISAIPTNRNTVTHILKKQFNSFDGEKISYKKENGNYGKVEISSSASVIYNGDILASGVAEKILTYQGTLILIDNDMNNTADVVIINNYTYDKIERIDTKAGKIYAQNKVFALEDYDAVNMVMAATGENVDINSLTAGDVIGFSETADREKLTMRIVRGGAGITVSYLGDGDFGTEDGIEFGTEILREEHKSLVKPGKTLSVYTDDGYNAVWIETAKEILPIGYLITIGEDSKLGKYIFTGVKLMDSKGDILLLEASDPEKIIFNGNKINTTELKQYLNDVKTKYNLGGDGEVSQIIAYKTDDNGCISEIHTINEENNGKLSYEYGYKNYGTARIRDDGYNSARYGVDRKTGLNYAFAIMNTHPIFEVPETGQEDAPDNYFSKKAYNKSVYKNGGWKIDSYVENEYDVVPEAMVIFKEAVDTNVDLALDGDIFFVEKYFYTRDSDDNFRGTLSGVEGSSKVSYYLDDSIESVVSGLKANDDNAQEENGITPGDAVNIARNTAGDVIAIEKVFDYETQTIKKAYADAAISDDFAVRLLRVYNLTDDGLMLEAFGSSLEDGIPGEEEKILINLYLRNRGGSKYIFFDHEEKTCNVGTVDDIIDYRQDPVNYTTIVISYWDNYIGGMMYYNK